MLTIFMFTVLFGISFGYLQAMIDPETKYLPSGFFFSLLSELLASEYLGLIYGFMFGFTIELIRQKEIVYRRSRKNHLQLSLDDSDDLEEDSTRQFSYDEDEEKISLISMNPATNKFDLNEFDNLDLKSDSDTDEETDVKLMIR